MTSRASALWKFSVNNLGALAQGNVDVKPLTLLCGPNNTGKTWLMYAIYGFLNNPGDKQLDGVESIVTTLLEQGVAELNMQDWLNKHFASTIATINQANKNELPALFSSNSALFAHSTFCWQIELDALLEQSYKSDLAYIFDLGGRAPPIFTATKSNDSHIINIRLLKTMPDAFIGELVTSLIYNHLMDKVGKFDAFLLPAERNGLHLFYRELSNRRTALLHHKPRNESDLQQLLKDVQGSGYARPIADYIDWLNRLTDIKKMALPSAYHDLAEELKKLVNGHYQIDDQGNITFTLGKKHNNPETAEMDLHLTSSTVKSLFGLWFYLEYQAKKHDVLMIDEPELNLHPGNQRAIARLISKMVNRGINVMVSTHSDYFIKELNSLIMLGSTVGEASVKNTLLKKYAIDDAMLLDKDNVIAYVFDNGSLEPMKINDEGIIATTFDEQIHALNDSSDDIYYSYVLKEDE